MEIDTRIRPAAGAACRFLGAPLGALDTRALRGYWRLGARPGQAQVSQLLLPSSSSFVDSLHCFSPRFESRVQRVSDSVVQRLRFGSISGVISSPCSRSPAVFLGPSKSYDIGGAFPRRSDHSHRATAAAPTEATGFVPPPLSNRRFLHAAGPSAIVRTSESAVTLERCPLSTVQRIVHVVT